MCPACRTRDGKIIGAGVNFQEIGVHRKSAELLTKCVSCGEFYLSDAFSPASKVVSDQWVKKHISEFNQYKSKL